MVTIQFEIALIGRIHLNSNSRCRTPKFIRPVLLQSTDEIRDKKNDHADGAGKCSSCANCKPEVLHCYDSPDREY